MAILGSKERKLVLSDIYQWILDTYPYFRRRGPGWRNSIRHNLSLNDCFIKAGRSANGKGHYWAIHPANVDDFERGDFRRRRAQRKVCCLVAKYLQLGCVIIIIIIIIICSSSSSTVVTYIYIFIHQTHGSNNNEETKTNNTKDNYINIANSNLTI